MIKMYIKPDCSTCRTAVKLIEENSSEKLETIKYLVDTPSEEEIKDIIKMLGIKPLDLVRKKEPLYKEKYKDRDISDAEWIKILHKHPILIERPIVVYHDKSIIGRPPEKIVSFIKA